MHRIYIQRVEIYKYIDLASIHFQRTPILNKKRISKRGLYEPPRLENQTGEYCFQFQCLLSATAASQITWFPKEKSFEHNLIE